MLTIKYGDCRNVLATLPAQSVQCCVTSPPYFGLRDYGVAGQIGLEATPGAYVAELVAVFREVRRVLRPGAPFVVAFSNRCFFTKAVAVWLDTTDEQHMALVRTYFDAAGGFTDVTAEDRSPGGDANPLYAVWARRDGRAESA